MKELSLNILDIAGNSIKAGAAHVRILIDETEDTFALCIEDDGCGMTAEQVQNVTDPFFTTRTTRKVGLGIPFLKLAAEQTGGTFGIESDTSPEAHGTKTRATFIKSSIDFTPLGDIISTVTTLIQGSPNMDWYFCHTFGSSTVCVDTEEIRTVLGEDVPLDNYEVIKWIAASMQEEYDTFNI